MAVGCESTLEKYAKVYFKTCVMPSPLKTSIFMLLCQHRRVACVRGCHIVQDWLLNPLSGSESKCTY